MYVIQISEEGKVVDMRRARADATTETIRAVDEIPPCEFRLGYRSVLMFSDEQGLYWDYVEVPRPTKEEPEVVEEVQSNDTVTEQTESE